MSAIVDSFRRAWSATTFDRDDLSSYARKNLVDEARNGVRAMSALLAALIIVAMLAHTRLNLNDHFFYAYGLVAALCIHIFIAAGQVNETRSLYLLGMALLVISATALVFVAHRTGVISPLLLGNLLLLFIVVPMVPWGLREACIVTATIWVLLTSSTIGVAARFGADALTLLQLFMFTTAFASLAVVARAVGVRKGELSARHQLEAAREDLIRLSNIDPLTGAWNRRYLDQAVAQLRERHGESEAHFALFDLDSFKRLNDTYGHAVGDSVLQTFSRTMQTALHEDGYFLRLGGDEFCAVIVCDEPVLLLESAISKATEAINALPAFKSADFSVSYGYASATLGDRLSIPVLYRRADSNMYRAKGGDDTAAADKQNATPEGDSLWISARH